MDGPDLSGEGGNPERFRPGPCDYGPLTGPRVTGWADRRGDCTLHQYQGANLERTVSRCRRVSRQTPGLLFANRVEGVYSSGVHSEAARIQSDLITSNTKHCIWVIRCPALME